MLRAADLSVLVSLKQLLQLAPFSRIDHVVRLQPTVTSPHSKKINPVDLKKIG
jgi:hypothetical protein